MTALTARQARIIGYARRHPTKSLRQIAKDLSESRWAVQQIAKGFPDIKDRVVVRKQRRKQGESIVDATWLHTGDILVNTLSGRRAEITEIRYEADLTRTFRLRPVEGKSRRSSLATMGTLKEKYYRAVTHEVRIS